MIAEETTINPDSVTVSGARKLIEGINQWFTESKKFKNVINCVETKLSLVDSLGRLITIDADQAEVTVNVEQIAENTYNDIPVKVLNNNDSVQILLLPPTIDVTIRGGINMMSDITADSLSASIDYNDLTTSLSSHIKPYVRAPRPFQVIAVHPDSVEFVIRK